MKTVISALALAATLGFAGTVAAEDAMATPMATDAMAGEAMAMSPEDMLKACLDKAGMETDAMKKDEATKACNAATPMAGDAMSATPMADGAMAPAQ